MSGKGSKPRPTDLPTFRENHDRIFRKEVNPEPEVRTEDLPPADEKTPPTKSDVYEPTD